MSKQEQKLTASQRLENLEAALMSTYQTMDNMARDLMTAKEAIKLLGNKLDAVCKASNLSDDQVAALMVENNVAELKSKVDEFIARGALSAAEVVEELSFVVGAEQDDDGKVVNPRLQFAMNALQPEVRSKIVGSKVGDVLTLQEGKLKFEVKEIYSINAPKPAPAPATEEAPAS